MRARARAALPESAGRLAKNDRHEPVSMAGRWGPPGAACRQPLAGAQPSHCQQRSTICQGRPALSMTTQTAGAGAAPMLHAGFGRPAVRPAAVRCCALQRPSIDLAACPHWLGRLPVAAGATAGAGPALHCSTRASAPVEAPAQPPPPCCPPCSPPCCCPLRRPAASGSASGTSTDLGCLPALGRLRNPRAACTGSGRCRREQHF